MGVLQKRSFEFEVRAEENESGEKIITGRPIVFNSRTNIGPFDEVIKQGALNNTDLTDVRFLVNHNTDMIPLARSRRNNGNSTMKITPDAEGLNIDFVKLDVENNADARALYSAVKRGDISGMSFMFYVRDDSWENLDTDHPTRYINTIESVVEVSAVTFPAYEATEIYARDKQAALDNANLALENARREARAASLDNDEQTQLALLKAKTQIISRG